MATGCVPTPQVRLSHDQVAAFRLRRHHLAERLPAGELVRAVRDVCGVQAQLAASARMALAARVEKIDSGDVDRALWEDRSLVKAWCMRGTAHLLPASDWPIYVAAVGPSVTASEMRWMARHGLTDDEARRIVDAVVGCLASGPITRCELADCVASSLGPETRKWVDHSWGGVVKLACVRGLMCFGPDQGQKATFVHRDWWLQGLPGAGNAASAGDAETFLMRQYLRSYAPATWRDFASWSGMRVTEAACIGKRLADDLVEVSVEGQAGFVLQEDLEAIQTAVLSASAPSVRLLPSFDSFLLGHDDKSHLVNSELYRRVFRKAGWLSPVVLVNGRVAGVWAQERKGHKLAVTVEPFGVFSEEERDLVAVEADNLGRFLGLPAQLRIVLCHPIQAS